MPTIEVDDFLPGRKAEITEVEPYYSRSGLSITLMIAAGLSLLVAMSQSNAYYDQFNKTPYHFWEAEKYTFVWRWLCAAWGFAVLAVLTTISRRVYRISIKAAIVALLIVSPAFAQKQFLPPRYVPNKKPAEQPNATAERQRLLDAATIRARQLQAENRSDSFRIWRILGGNSASEARIVSSEDGLLTLQKRDLTMRTFKETRLGKLDREYLDKWKKKTQRPNTTPGLIQPAKTTKPKAATIPRKASKF